MTDHSIEQLAKKYRSAIEAARDDGLLGSDFSFRNFPNGCCGDTSYLFAEYLRKKGVETIWYSAQRGDWSHAWLVVKDKRVKKSPKKAFLWTEELRALVAQYSAEDLEEEDYQTRYGADDLQAGLIIDITADQFDDYDIPVYVGHLDEFHQSFEFNEASDYDGLNNGRLCDLYEKIERYL